MLNVQSQRISLRLIDWLHCSNMQTHGASYISWTHHHYWSLSSRHRNSWIKWREMHLTTHLSLSSDQVDMGEKARGEERREGKTNWKKLGQFAKLCKMTESKRMWRRSRTEGWQKTKRQKRETKADRKWRKQVNGWGRQRERERESPWCLYLWIKWWELSSLPSLPGDQSVSLCLQGGG